jgi:hypothetical protein
MAFIACRREALAIEPLFDVRSDLELVGCATMPAGAIEARKETLERLGGPARARASMHQRGVRRDPVHPRAEPRITSKRAEAPEDPKQRLLGDVEGVVVVPDETAGESEHAVLIACHELLERGGLAGHGPRHQCLVAL